MSAGCIAGAVEATSVWPLEFIKTNLQLGSTSGKKLPYNGVLQGLSYTVRTTGFFRYVSSQDSSTKSSIGVSNIIFCLLSILLHLTNTSLYRGLAPTLIGSVPKAGIRFGLNSVIKDKLRDENGKLTVGKNFVAGLGAGVTEALVIVAPVETVKTKVIELNMSFVTGLKHIIKTEGLGGIYQGVRSGCAN